VSAWPEVIKSYHWTCCCLSASIWHSQPRKLTYCELLHPVSRENFSPYFNHLLVFSFHCGGAEEGSLLWFTWTGVQFKTLSCVAASDNGKRMCSWMCYKPYHVSRQHTHSSVLHLLSDKFKITLLLLTKNCGGTRNVLSWLRCHGVHQSKKQGLWNNCINKFCMSLINS